MSGPVFLNSRQVKYAMEQRKRMDQEKQLMEFELEQQKKVNARTAFEINTSAKINMRLRSESLTKKKEALERALFERRQQLAGLLNSEMEAWRHAVMYEHETPEMRREAMLERAYALRDAREAARRKLVQDKLDAQWRDGCDDARFLDSQEMNRFMARERAAQVFDKENRRQSSEADDNAFLAEWNRQLSVTEDRDRAKEAARRQAEMDTQAALAAQIQANEDMKARHAALLKEEEDRELEEVRRALADEASQRQRQAEAAQERGRDVFLFNAHQAEARDQQAALEAERDAMLLSHALAQEREQVAREKAKADEGYEQARQYRKYLEELMVREKADNSVADGINQAEAEKIWKARDDALKAREDARNYLMEMVTEGRKQQIADRAAAQHKEKADDKVYAQKFVDDIKEGFRKDQEEAAVRRRLAEDNNVRLMEQIAERRRQEEAAKQEVYLSDLHMRHIEKQHKERLRQQAGNVRLQFPLKKPDY